MINLYFFCSFIMQESRQTIFKKQKDWQRRLQNGFADTKVAIPVIQRMPHVSQSFSFCFLLTTHLQAKIEIRNHAPDF